MSTDFLLYISALCGWLPSYAAALASR